MILVAVVGKFRLEMSLNLVNPRKQGAMLSCTGMDL